jgi:hypothetical protein
MASLVILRTRGTKMQSHTETSYRSEVLCWRIEHHRDQLPSTDDTDMLIAHLEQCLATQGEIDLAERGRKDRRDSRNMLYANQEVLPRSS